MIRKAVIPVAGFGTRFLPATKAMPKEMLPVIDKPVIQYIVEEAVASGITDIILVTSSAKRPVEDHFDDNQTLEAWLKATGKKDQLAEVRAISHMANFIYVRQKGPYGNATPVLNAKEVVGDEPFAVIYGDDLMQSRKPRLKQMIETFEKYGDPVLFSYKVSKEDTKRYGIIDPGTEVEPNVFRVKSVVEKPGPAKAPSRLASLGAYILTPDIFEAIEHTKKGLGGELFLLDAIFMLMKKRPVYARLIEGTYFDTGSKIGWLEANLKLALERPDLRNDLRKLLKKLK